jgi:type IV pilus assembly protein PilW
MKTKNMSNGRRARGFTLIEVLVALALGVLILLALTVLFARNTGNHSELERTTRQLESARFSIVVLGEDLMHAGFYGEFNPNTLTTGVDFTWRLHPVAPIDLCATAINALGWNTAGAPALIPVPVEGIAAGTALLCLPNRQPNTEAIVVRHAETGAATTIAAGANNDLYIQVARCPTEVPLTPIRAAAGNSGTFTLTRPDCATVNNSVRRLTQRIYYIASCNDCAAADGIPTLKRVEMIGGLEPVDGYLRAGQRRRV